MNRILVGLDGSDRAPEVLQRAVTLAKALGGKLLLFRAVGITQMLNPIGDSPVAPNDMPEVVLQEARTELAKVAELAPPILLEGMFAEIGVPWDALCAAAKRYDVDLIVIGSHGYGGIDRLLGTTAAKVVNHADRDVLVARARK